MFEPPASNQLPPLSLLDDPPPKEGGYSPEALEAARRKAIAEAFTADELRRLKGASHWECHYWGAAKIIAPIGKAFADAMVLDRKSVV